MTESGQGPKAARILLVFALPALLSGAAAGHELARPDPALTRAAREFLATLRPQLREACLLPMDSSNRLDWSYVPGRRKGVSVKDMNDAERRAAQAMLRAALSSRGYEKAEGVRELEGILRGIQRSDFRDPDLYYVTVFGSPSDETPWGWRFEGHHVSLSFSSETGALVSSTPAFFGANPARVPSGPRAGWRLLPAEEDLARELLASLDQAQRGRAVIATGAPADIILGPGRKSVPEPAGLTYAEMTPPQRDILMRLIGAYLDNLRADAADRERARIEKAGLDRIRFGWAGGIRIGEGHYYRVQGPTFVIEYDNTQDGANHVHSVFRDLEEDFGGDLLRRHYAESPHHAAPATPALAAAIGRPAIACHPEERSDEGPRTRRGSLATSPTPQPVIPRSAATRDPVLVSGRDLREVDSLDVRGQRLRLQLAEFLQPLARQLQQLGQLLLGERAAFGRALDLDERAAGRADDVAVDVGLRIFRVGQVEDGLARADPDRHGGNRLAQRPAGNLSVATELRQGHGQRDAGARDPGAAGAAVGLEDVAVERDRALAEAAQLRDAAQRPADQPLNLERPAALLAERRLAGRARVRGAREHAVLGRDPSAAGALQERRHAILDRGGAENLRVTQRDQRGPFRVPRDAGLDGGRAQLGRLAPVGSRRRFRHGVGAGVTAVSVAGGSMALRM